MNALLSGELDALRRAFNKYYEHEEGRSKFGLVSSTFRMKKGVYSVMRKLWGESWVIHSTESCLHK